MDDISCIHLHTVVNVSNNIIRFMSDIYHHGEDDGSPGGFDDPEENQTAELDDGEQMNLSERDVSQVNEVWLVFSRHPEQSQTIKKLR